MATNQIITRQDAAALIPEEIASEVITNVPKSSAALSLFKNVPMSSSQTRQPVLSTLPQAYFVTGDTGLKQTSKAAWGNKFLNAEEIAVIVPIPEAVLDDASFDVWAAIQPTIAEAIGRTLDGAIFLGSDKPSSWPTAIVPAAIAAGNKVARATNSPANGGIAGDFSDLFATVENDLYPVNGVIASQTLKGKFRNNRNADGTLNAEVGVNEVFGVPVSYQLDGQWATGANAVEAIAGDFAGNGIVGVRQDITYKILDQAVITDGDGKVVLNLAQQDAVAMRVVARYAYQVANAVSAGQGANPYPFGVMTSPAA